MSRRVQRFAFPAVANGAQSGPQQVATFDDPLPRVLRGLRFIVPTAGLRVQIDVAGRVFVDIDTSTFTAAGPEYLLDQPFPSGILFSVNVINNSGAGVPANAGVELLYDAGGGLPAGLGP